MPYNSFADMKRDSMEAKAAEEAYYANLPVVEEFSLPTTLEEAHRLILKYRKALEDICEEGYGSAVDIADTALGD